MAKQVIAADYDRVKASIRTMDNNVNQIISEINTLENVINYANEWKGVDAAQYKIALGNYIRRIKNSANWLRNLDGIISKHAYALYQRALNDKNATTFR